MIKINKVYNTAPKPTKTQERIFNIDLTANEVGDMFIDKAIKILNSQFRKFSACDPDATQYAYICRYLAGETKEAKNALKALLIRGNIGTGKTFIIQVLAAMLNDLGKHLRIIHAIEIVDAYRRDNNDEISRFKSGLICIDDLGSEEPSIINYGSHQHPVYDVLSHRHIKKMPTFITTNLTSKQIEERYGERIRDRLREMCNEIKLTGISKRN